MPDLIGSPVRISMILKRGRTAFRKAWLNKYGNLDGYPY